MTSPEDYLGRIQAIVWAASDYVSTDGLKQVQQLVDHGEPAEGMCSLAWVIVNEQRKVPRAPIRDIRLRAAGLVDDQFMPDNLDEFGTDDSSP